MKPLKVVLVDDNYAFRKALKLFFINQYDATIIGEAENANDFWKIYNYHTADIILMDIMLPGTDGIELSQQILAQHNNLKIIGITMHYEEVYLNSLVKTGFAGCIYKSNLVKELEPAVNAVIHGELYFPQNMQLEGLQAATI